MKRKRPFVLLLEPFYGGSHKAFVDGIRKHSRHRVEALTLPARFWKWRMRGAAILLAKRMNGLPRRPDVILASDMLSVPDLKALSGGDGPPVLLYMHENQISYPLPTGERRDYQFAFTNVTSCLAADRVIFNSSFHREGFLQAVPGLIRMMPDCRPGGVVETIREKSLVLPPGCDFASLQRGRRRRNPREPLTILWNHRWEFDKAPEVFFDVLYRLQAARRRFRLIVCGENFQARPRAFLEARRRLRRRILHFGYEPSRRRYAELLAGSDIIVSTAVQENFGLSVLEGIWAGCYPLLPNRLSYPELLAPRFHADHLYAHADGLCRTLGRLLRDGLPATFDAEALRGAAEGYDWRRMIARYDDLLEEVG